MIYGQTQVIRIRIFEMYAYFVISLRVRLKNPNKWFQSIVNDLETQQ